MPHSRMSLQELRLQLGFNSPFFNNCWPLRPETSSRTMRHAIAAGACGKISPPLRRGDYLLARFDAGWAHGEQPGFKTPVQWMLLKSTRLGEKPDELTGLQADVALPLVALLEFRCSILVVATPRSILRDFWPLYLDSLYAFSSALNTQPRSLAVVVASFTVDAPYMHMNTSNTNTTSVSVHGITLGVAGLSLKKTNHLEFDDGPRKFLARVDRLPSSFGGLYEACKMELVLQGFDNLGLQPAGDDARELDTLVQGLAGLGLQPAGMDAVEEEQLCRGVSAMSLRKMMGLGNFEDDGDVVMEDVKPVNNVRIASSPVVPRPVHVSHASILASDSHCPHSPTLITAVPVAFLATAVPVPVPATSSPLQNRINTTSINGVKSKTKKISGGVKRTTSGGKENAVSSGRKGSLARRP
ncbi:hypothetical protein C8R46DRAFT_1197658 [Mycena filopes]|nr:hypothetical protein C8R46DRAFT_1197658 [Mycena filopes]